jgi:uncharacterized spore protein YtfJ
MGKKFDDIIVTAVRSEEQGKELMEKLVAVAQPSAVFSEPIVSGDYMIITASEVSVGLGFGYGIGGETAPETTEGAAASPDESESQGSASGVGGGGGGGGYSAGRPVAVISVGPRGVRVEPVRDVTKVLLALLTVAGSMLMMLGRMRKTNRG